MEIAIYDGGLGLTYAPFQCGKFCFGNAFYALELLQQGCFCLWANAVYGVQFACYLVLASLFPVERDGIAVNFLLYAYQQAEQRAVGLHADGLGRKSEQ